MVDSYPDEHSAFVLHSQPWKEHSELLEVLTPDAGRLGVIRKVGRTSKVKRLPMFQHLIIDWRGQGELKTLGNWRTEGQLHWLTGDLLILGMYVNELIVRLIPKHAPQETLFGLYAATLHLLTHPSEQQPVESALRYFERMLLREMGFEIPFHVDASGLPISPECHYCFGQDYGFFQADNPLDNQIPGSVLLAIDQNLWQTDGALAWAKKIFRVAIQHQLGDKPLKTRELLSR